MTYISYMLTYGSYKERARIKPSLDKKTMQISENHFKEDMYELHS